MYTRYDRLPITVLDSGVFLSERPCERLDTVRNPLELVLLLTSDFVHLNTVFITVAPLDFHCVEIDLDARAVDVLGRAGGKPAKSANKVQKLLHVVTDHVSQVRNWSHQSLTQELRLFSRLRCRCRMSWCGGLRQSRCVRQ